MWADHHLRRGPLQDQAQRDAPAEPLQPADGDLLHDRPVHHHRRAVLLHDPGPERGAGRGGRARGHRSTWSARSGRGPSTTRKPTTRPSGRTSTRPARSTRRPTLYLPVEQVRAVQPLLARRHPLLLGPVLLPQAGRRPGPPQLLRRRRRPRRAPSAGKCAELCGTYHSAMLFNVAGGQRGGVPRLPEDPGRQGSGRGGQGSRRRQRPREGQRQPIGPQEAEEATR